jgi:fatty acid desaturase
MIDARYLGLLTALAAVAGAAAWPWVDRWPGGREGLVVGIAFSLLSLGAGYHVIRRSARRGGTRFFAAVVGSTVARVLGLLALALALAATPGIHLGVALLTVVGLHFALGTFEIVYLKRTEALG